MAANASAAAESLDFKHVGQQIATELLLEEQKPSFEANLFLLVRAGSTVICIIIGISGCGEVQFSSHRSQHNRLRVHLCSSVWSLKFAVLFGQVRLLDQVRSGLFFAGTWTLVYFHLSCSC